MRKVVIVMTHFERPAQLANTLRSIAQSKYDNFEVVIVDDGSHALPRLGLSSFKISLLRTARKCWTNPEPAYNLGLLHALTLRPDVIIVQNAECYHVNDVISFAAGVGCNDYISFGCFSINEANTFRPHDISALLMANELGASHDGQNAWYNHPVFRPVAYDFCGAMTAENMLRLNGYDERFSDGCGYGDDFLLARIHKLGLRVSIVTDPFVVHQWHYNGLGVPANKGALVAKNKQLYQQLTPPADVRAVHLHTEDLKKTYAEN